MKIPRLNSVVEVVFMDHVEDDTKVAPVVVYGKLSKKTKDSIVVECWRHPDPDTADDYKETDTKRYAIVKKAITDIHQLKRVVRKK